MNLLHVETHQREAVDNCCVPVQLAWRLQGRIHLAPCYYDILGYRGKRSSLKHIDSQSFRNVCKFFTCFPFMACSCLSALCASNTSTPKSAVQCCLPQQFQTAALPLNQPARETFPHSLSLFKHSVPPSPLNHPGSEWAT